MKTHSKKDKKNLEKKSQAEMFGLIFIVMLISIALLLVAQAEINRKPTDIKQDFERSELATNTINALLNTRTVGCNELDISDLLVDCAKNPENPEIRCEDGSTSCNFARDVTTVILANTLDAWNKKYYINMYRVNSEETIFEFASSDQEPEQICPAIDRKVASHPLPLYPGTLVIETWLCG